MKPCTGKDLDDFIEKAAEIDEAIPTLCCSGKLVKDKTNCLEKYRDFGKDHCIEGVYGFQVLQTIFRELTRTQKFFKKSYIKKKLNRKIGFASLRCRVKNSNQTIKWVSQAFPPKWLPFPVPDKGKEGYHKKFSNVYDDSTPCEDLIPSKLTDIR